MWKRSWFFIIDSLQITAGERRIILTLVTLIIAIHGFKLVIPSETIYDQAYYEPIITEFHRLSGVAEEERNIVLARYFPPSTAFLSSMNITLTPFYSWGFTSSFSGSERKTEPNSPRGSSRKNRSIDEEKIENVQHQRIPVQTASRDELITLPGIGPVTADRIIIYREENGPFESVEDLLKVSGIGPVTLDRIRDRVYIE